MKIQDLKDVVKKLETLIKESELSKNDLDIIELEKTAFYKFQKYVDWWELIQRWKVISSWNDKIQKALELEILNKWFFIKEQINIFIEYEMKNQREKLNFN